jgi:hypothetical protein
MDDAAPPRAFCPPPTTPPVTPPVVLRAVPPLTWLPPGYLFAPIGFAPMDFDVPVVGLFDAGNEFDRLTTGLRAVDGRAFAEGW